MDIGNSIKYHRKIKGMTQQELADKSSISRSYLADVERNRYNPSIETLQKIAEALGVSVEDLFKSKLVAEKPLKKWDEEYDSKKFSEEVKLLENKKITDVKEAMEIILTQPGLMLNGEMLSDESKIALANAIQMGLAYAEQMQKKEKEKNKK
ncbi:DNA-binding transcriptional regulator, XRE-family HTH domain [Caloramator quimbayensis]|uniref:DNA-binding transcriptional regulator, XRE-family HTH domain n=1 Tax=Caloramator quimbayensis TaxID=1147123 RepID=A0A1T4YFP4_9CLOT|nr:helix-turn-helix transcriptional regulator [Caloramator quimbayensis]SKB00045.1 DNA-binding transcriptional regulator, XRE-family HTH domain [Caloramator quimbayensis]